MAKHFSLRQCIYSKTAIDLGIDNTPGVDAASDPLLTKDYIVNNINNLMKNCVNPIVDFFPDVVITCVYRSKKLNASLNPPGANNSQHIHGMAADLISTTDTPSYEIFNWAVMNLKEWDQIIWEYPEKGFGVRGSWVHISYKEGNNRKKTSLASNMSNIHLKYNPNHTGLYQHGIEIANSDYIA